MKLPDGFLKRMEERLGKDFPAFLRSYDRAPYKGLRVNTLKIGLEEFLENAPFPIGEQVTFPAGEDITGFYHNEEKAGAYPEHFAGLYYLQEPSAMRVGELTAPVKKERVLDLCAAPGGKTVQLAVQMEGDGVLISNEIDANRAKILSQNAERMGLKNCAVTNATPAQLSERFPAYFDLVLVDAPCSGEGMFLKEPEAVPHWSENNVLFCAERQKEILDCAAKMVANGGFLVYSTCTFSEEEDEKQARTFLQRHPDFEMDGAFDEYKIYPHEFKGEGHYCVRFEKTGGERKGAKPFPVKRNAAANRAFAAFAEEFFVAPPAGEITTLDDGRMFLVPLGMPAPGVRTLRLGVELGAFDGKTFKPAHALAMSLKQEECKNFVPLSREQAEKYLRGETIECENKNGWCVAGLGKFPLGLGKIVNGTMKNHLPKGLRKFS